MGYKRLWMLNDNHPSEIDFGQLGHYYMLCDLKESEYGEGMVE